MDDILQIIQHGIEELNVKMDVHGEKITRLEISQENMKTDFDEFKCEPKERRQTAYVLVAIIGGVLGILGFIYPVLAGLIRR